MASQTITLFTQQNDFGPRPTSFAVSVVVHGMTAAVVLFAFAYRPPTTRVITEHYSMRELDLNFKEAQAQAVRSLMPPAPHAGPRAPSSAGNSAPSPPVPPPMTAAARGPQTLIQPELPKPVVLPEPIPLPQVVIWQPSRVVVKKIVPPQPQKPASATVKPNLERPNEEMNLADVNISSSFHPSAKSIVTPSTTTPVTVPLPQQVQLPPVSVTQPSQQPTPAAILSISDLHMNNGSANLPPVSESALSTTQGMLAPNQMRDLSLTAKEIPPGNPGQGSGTGFAKTNGAANSAGQGAAATPNNGGSAAGQGSQGKPNGSGLATASGTPNTSNSPSGSEAGQFTSTQITLPKDGKFGAVVVGDSLQDQYPETSGVWGSRMAYTVYLHVGLAKNWIMQYALPHTGDGSNAGSVIRLDAPWPYSIVRPNVDPNAVDADAIMIHGFIDQSGRFEKLTMILPPSFPQAQFVLAALSKWQFRPASQNGQSTRVEVLIIIPQVLD